MSEHSDSVEVIDAVAVLIAHAEGTKNHTFNGLCPDEIAGLDSRDEDCPVCRALTVLGRCYSQAFAEARRSPTESQQPRAPAM